MTHTINQPERLERSGVNRIFVVLLLQAVELFLLLAGAGTVHWPAAWAYEVLRLVALAGFGLYMVRTHPAIINERGRKPRDVRPFDKVFTAVYGPLYLLLPLVAGLDFRFGWSDMAWPWRWLGLAALILGIVLPYAAMAANAYLTVNVRVQEERGHQVVSGGPYRFMRHPMYTGMALGLLGLPLFLGSWWGVLVGILAAAALVWRTQKEDNVLQVELPGYAAYAAQVRYRLLPGVW